MSKSRLDIAYSYKYAGLSKEERKLLTKKDDELHRTLLQSHITGVSFISPRKEIADYAGKRVISSVRCSIWIGDRSDTMSPSNVKSRANKAWMFYKRGEGIVGFAEELYANKENNDCLIQVSVLEKPLYFDGDCVLFSDYKEKAEFMIEDKDKLETIIHNFVEKGTIQEPKSEAKKENVIKNTKEENNIL